MQLKNHANTATRQTTYRKNAKLVTILEERDISIANAKQHEQTRLKTTASKVATKTITIKTVTETKTQTITPTPRSLRLR